MSSFNRNIFTFCIKKFSGLKNSLEQKLVLLRSILVNSNNDLIEMLVSLLSLCFYSVLRLLIHDRAACLFVVLGFYSVLRLINYS